MQYAFVLGIISFCGIIDRTRGLLKSLDRTNICYGGFRCNNREKNINFAGSKLINTHRVCG